MTPTEHELTVATDAVARYLHRQQQAQPDESWDDLGPIEKHFIREAALPLAVVALEAIPDRAAAGAEEALVEVTRRLTQTTAGLTALGRDRSTLGVVSDVLDEIRTHGRAQTPTRGSTDESTDGGGHHTPELPWRSAMHAAYDRRRRARRRRNR